MIDYLAVEGRFEHEIVIERSRFIATIQGVLNAEDALAFVSEIRKKYNDATHNCYAYISNVLGLEQRFSDDGEPQGTAGQPMLEVLKKKSLFCTAVVVTRYFGGVKLGGGGLVSAYTRAVAEVIDKSDILLNRLSDILEIVCDYAQYNTIIQNFKLESAVIRVDFINNVTLTVAIPTESTDSFIENICNLTAGKVDCKKIEQKYFKYKNQ
ncbi:MAG: YigZ family protein [Clostridia bacterium]